MKNVNKINLDMLRLKPGDSILDVGCSYGDQAMRIAKQGLKVYGVDNLPNLINKFRKTAQENKLTCFPVVGEAKNMPFKNGQFDAVVATEVLEHIPSAKEVIDEIFRVLRSHGRICISVPTKFSEKIFSFIHPMWLQNSGHVNIFSRRDIVEMLKEAGFKIEKIEMHNFEWTGFWIVHSFFKTKFDSTGSPLENHHLSEKYFKIWNYLDKLKIGRYLLWFGNLILPKSFYIYALKS